MFRGVLVILLLVAVVTAKTVPSGAHQNGSEIVGGKIVGGQNASPGQCPFIVSIRAAGQHICGGSIIAPRTVLTAAHCIYGQKIAIFVVAGIIHLTDAGIFNPVLTGIIHPGYNHQTLINDIAVLTVAIPFIYNENVQPIRLASNNPNPGEVLTLYGWGLTSFPGNTPNDLQYINLRNLDLQTCAKLLSGANPVVTVGDVCTTSPAGQGACQGDSGGPLINSQGELVGVVSWGVPCAKGLPDVFTSVPFYRQFILAN